MILNNSYPMPLSRTVKRMQKDHKLRAKLMGYEYDEGVNYFSILQRCGNICGICHREIIEFGLENDDKTLSFDHIVSMCFGGRHEESNIQPVHLGCNKFMNQLDWFIQKF